MRIGDLERFLGILGVENIIHKGTWIMCSCPRASHLHDGGTDRHPSFGVYANDSGISTFNCFVCGTGTTLDLLHFDFLTRGYRPELHKFLGTHEYLCGSPEVAGKALSFRDGYTRRDAWSITAPIPSEVVEQYPLIEQEQETYEGRKCIEWLESRGISRRLVFSERLRLCEEYRAVVFEIKDTDGRTYALHVRSRTGKLFLHLDPVKTGHPELSWGNKSVWYGMHEYDPVKPVILVEGQLDALRLRELGYKNVLASVGGVSHKQATRISSSIVYLGFDSDRAGDTFAERVIRANPSSRYRRLVWKDEGLKDAGDLVSREQAERVFGQARAVILQGGKVRYTSRDSSVIRYKDKFTKGV